MLKRRWDTYSAYLFDIDGTLLHCRDAVHYFGFCRVLSRTAGRALNLDGVHAHGNTDVGIMRDALQLAGYPDALWRPQLHVMQEELCCFVEEHSQEFQIDSLPGASAVLEHLRLREARLGVATGNLERIGWAKLQAAGLAHRIHFGAFSDDHEYRADVFRAALTVAKAEADCDAGAVCVVGDTPADIDAAHRNGLEVIAVATGTYSHELLERAGPDLLVPTLTTLLSGY